MIFKHIGTLSSVADYSKEDVAATLLHSVCDNLVTTVLNAMHLTKTTHTRSWWEASSPGNPCKTWSSRNSRNASGWMRSALQEL